MDIEQVEGEDIYEMVLSLALLDKRSAGKRLRAVSDDLIGYGSSRNLRDILESSFFSAMESSYNRLEAAIFELSNHDEQ